MSGTERPSQQASGDTGVTERPKPLVASDVVLQDFRFLPIDITRLFGSRFHAIASDSEWRAGVTLWLKSYHQVPAGSLPNDDIELARLAEFGRNLKDFRKVKQVALYGWIECTDGRLYHHVVAEKVNEAWAKKQQHRGRASLGAAKRWGKQQKLSAKSKDKDAVALAESPASPHLTDMPQASIMDASSIPQACLKHPSSMLEASYKHASSTPEALPKQSLRMLRDRDRDTKKDDTICAEPSADVSALPADVFITLPLVDGTEHVITTADIAFWRTTYPAVDVEQGFRSMRAWLTTNPSRRKTRKGVGRFVNAWLEREQNRGGAGVTTALRGTRPSGDLFERNRRTAAEWAAKLKAKEGAQ